MNLRLSPKDRHQIPDVPGVYVMYQGEGVIYVGKAKSLKNRVGSYFVGVDKHNRKTQRLVESVEGIEFFFCESEFEALVLEQSLIREHQPKFNILLRDDKSYPFLLLSSHEFPGLYLKRDRHLSRAKNRAGERFGPLSVPRARAILDIAELVLGVRSCLDGEYRRRTRPCLQYEIGRCSGPCVGLIERSEYSERVALLSEFLKGRTAGLLRLLKAQEARHAEEEAFEKAASLRALLETLESYEEERTQVAVKLSGDCDAWGVSLSEGRVCVYLLMVRHGRISEHRQFFAQCLFEESPEEILSQHLIQYYLKTPEDVRARIILAPLEEPLRASLEALFEAELDSSVPRIITQPKGTYRAWARHASQSAELYAKLPQGDALSALDILASRLSLESLESLGCLDISHQGGKGAVGSFVLERLGVMEREAYRLFHLDEVPAGDDYEGMRVLVRRLFRNMQEGGASAVDLLVMDGGIGQMRSAFEALSGLQYEKNVPILGSAKGPTRKNGDERYFYVLYQPSQPMPTPVEIDLPTEARKPIWQIQSEAHRFAITNQRKRGTRAVRSRLEDVAGIGQKRRAELLRVFGSLSGLLAASKEEIHEKTGLPLSLCEKLLLELKVDS